jgi:hypothetical protein
MISSRWKRFVDNLHAHSKKEAYLAGTILVLSWLVLFLGIGRTPCPGDKPSNSDVIQRRSNIGIEMPKATAPTRLLSATSSRRIQRTCFGFNWPGTVASDTLIWLTASFFPGSALLLFAVLTRLDEIVDSAQKTGTYYL